MASEAASCNLADKEVLAKHQVMPSDGSEGWWHQMKPQRSSNTFDVKALCMLLKGDAVLLTANSYLCQ